MTDKRMIIAALMDLASRQSVEAKELTVTLRGYAERIIEPFYTAPAVVDDAPWRRKGKRKGRAPR